MRFLIDEMFAPKVAERLRDSGHDAIQVAEVGLGAASDPEVMSYAAADGRVVVTGNAADFLPLLDERIAAGIAVRAVVIALKSNLPRASGAMSRALADELDAWAETRTDPYHYVHWMA